jgi:cell division septation protein DedD
VPVDSSKNNAPVQPEISPEPAATSETAEMVAVTETIYHVIAGSFQSEVNAGIMMRKLAEEGYIPELMKAPNGFFRVCAVKCKSLEEAVEKRDSINVMYAGTWITRIR